MKKVLIRGEITAEHVRKLWDAVATASDAEGLMVVLDNCTGAQPWAMMAAVSALDAFSFPLFMYIRGDCLSAGVTLVAGQNRTRTANPETRFLPHGADVSTSAGRRRNRWQAWHLQQSVRWTDEKAMSVLEAGDCWLTAEQAQEQRLVDRIGSPPDWARELLEEGGDEA